jgi:uncharacterized protein with GYD domain
MATYIILGRFSPQTFADPKDFKKLAETVSEKIRHECPGVHWKDSYATTGQYDVIDVIEAEDIHQVTKAAMIIQSYGHSSTETLVATPWNEFLSVL